MCISRPALWALFVVCCGSGSLVGDHALAETPTAGSETARAEMLIESCAACHGPEGRSPGSIPPLAGMAGDQIAAALMDYRGDARPATVMNRISRGFTDDEIAAIGAYFAARQ